MTETSDPAEWSRHARARHAHYLATVVPSGNELAVALNERRLAAMVPLLCDAIDALTKAPTEEDAAPTEEDAAPTVEHAIQMSGGGMHVRWDDPEMEDIYPLAEWIPAQQRFGGKVYRRTVIVVADWEEVPE